MVRSAGNFRLTRAKAESLARALRTASWVSSLGDLEATLTHDDGTEVTITVYAPGPAPAPRRPIGFRMEGRP